MVSFIFSNLVLTYTQEVCYSHFKAEQTELEKGKVRGQQTQLVVEGSLTQGSNNSFLGQLEIITVGYLTHKS